MSDEDTEVWDNINGDRRMVILLNAILEEMEKINAKLGAEPRS